MKGIARALAVSMGLTRWNILAVQSHENLQKMCQVFLTKSRFEFTMNKRFAFASRIRVTIVPYRHELLVFYYRNRSVRY
jgi:hypothetical protein